MNTLKRLAILTAGCALLALGVASPAAAVTVKIGLALDGGLVSEVADGSYVLHDGSATYDYEVPDDGAAKAGFTSISATGKATPKVSLPFVLNSTSIDTSSSGNHTLDIYVTALGLTAADLNGQDAFLNTLQLNSISGTLTFSESTYIDTGNGLFSTVGQVAMHSFGTSAPDTYQSKILFDVGAGDFSVTQVYHIDSGKSGGSINANISLSTVPLPAALPLFAAGLFGAPLVGRLRRRRASQPA